jgi:hypothetical protein
VNPKETRAWLKLARDHGARIVNGKKHIKVYAEDGRYLLSLAHGRNRSTHPAGDEAYKVARREGWLD